MARTCCDPIGQTGDQWERSSFCFTTLAVCCVDCSFIGFHPVLFGTNPGAKQLLWARLTSASLKIRNRNTFSIHFVSDSNRKIHAKKRKSGGGHRFHEVFRGIFAWMCCIGHLLILQTCGYLFTNVAESRTYTMP